MALHCPFTLVIHVLEYIVPIATDVEFKSIGTLGKPIPYSSETDT